MTRPVTWLELGQKVAEAHARHALDSVSVIPIVVDQLDAARPILNALADMHEGCFLDASNHTADASRQLNVYEPVPGTTSPVRRKAIEVALSRSRKPVRIVDVADQFLDVRFADSSLPAELSTGDRTLHAVARAAAHRYLDECSFAVIAYKSGLLDDYAKKAAWDLMVRHVQREPRKSPQTLVVAVESDMDVGIHCQTEYGFRFAVDDGGLLCRRGLGHLRGAASTLVEQSKESPVVFFLGAGFSVSSQMPMGDQLRDNAILRMLNDSKKEALDSVGLAMEFHNYLSSMDGSSNWLSAAERSMNSRAFANELTLERVLAAEKRMRPDLPTLLEFKERHDKVVGSPGLSVRVLTEILKTRAARLVIVQLNFDCLVEHNTKSGIRVFASNAAFEEAPEYICQYCAGAEEDPPLLKLHGTIESLDTCVFAQDQTDRGVGEPQFRTLTALRDVHDGPLPWIYVGVSMRDRDLLQVLSGQDFARRLDERWVVPYIVPSVRSFGELRTPHWAHTDLKGLEDRVIAETSDAFFDALGTAWP